MSPVPVRVRNLRFQAFMLTFVAYAAFHMARKPPAIVKSVLHPQSSDGSSGYNRTHNPGWTPFSNDVDHVQVSRRGYSVTGIDGDDDINGDYDCVEYDKEKICVRYRRQWEFEHESSQYFLRLTSNVGSSEEYQLCEELRKQHTQKESKYDDPTRCWVIVAAQPTNTVVIPDSTIESNKNSDDTAKVLYIQGSGGRIPAIVVTGTDKLAHYWYKVVEDTDDSKFNVNKDIRAIPRATNGKLLLGAIDTVFLSAYTIGLFVSGWAADHVKDLRTFLSIGLWGSGLSITFIGLAYWMHIHSFEYFCFVSAMAGLFQSIGWPTIITIMSNWYGKKKRGFIFGVWNSHQSLGNILGSVITSASVSIGMHKEDWPMGYIVPGFICMCIGLVTFAFLIPHPKDAGVNEADSQALAYSVLHSIDDTDETTNHEDAESGDGHNVVPSAASEYHDESGSEDGDGHANGHQKGNILSHFIRAIKIPGVIPYSLSLAFAKLVGYAILFWAPSYIAHLGASPENAGYLSTFFDIGGVFGGISAGYFSDRFNTRAIVAFSYLLLSALALYCYYEGSTYLAMHGDIVGHSESVKHALLMVFAGFSINGPTSLIITAVSADLGTHPSLKGDASLLATVTGIIDGTGSLGAVIQGVLVGSLSTSGWVEVFNFLMLCCVLSALCLSQLVYKDIQRLRNQV